MHKFLGRKKELKRLIRLLDREIPRLIVLKGRRRIGKSRLLREFGNLIGNAHIFSGLAPEEGVTAQHQRDEFASQLQKEFGVMGIKSDNWSDLFWHLSNNVKEGRRLVVLDEISWMAADDPTFLPKLKNAWDLYFTQNNKLILALCGSISAWIEKNILSSTAFMGRQSLDMTLKEIPIMDCNHFWDDGGKGTSAQDKLMMLAVIGGVPRYLEEITPQLSTEKNIKELCFNPGGILFSEFDKIFSDLFSERQEIYKSIVTAIVNNKKQAGEIRTQISLGKGGDIYEYLNDLVQAGFIARDYTWKIKNGKISMLSEFRICDNYTRFYLKYILPNRMQIQTGDMGDMSLFSLPGWAGIMGLQFENLVLNNRQLIKETLGLTSNDIVCDNPYFQNKTKQQRGCQIDYMIQVLFNTVYVCEIRYSKNPIRLDIIDEVKQKIERLSLPKNFSYRPVLIHCNEVHESVEDTRYFSHIINFADFLECETT